MIDFYFVLIFNGYKIMLFFEEVELDYRLIKVDLGKGGQFCLEFLCISFNNKILVIVDYFFVDGGELLSFFEFGVILLYLVEKIGFFLSYEMCECVVILQWLFWQVGGLGSMFG